MLDEAGTGLVRADYTTEAMAADASQARQLGVAAGSPLLLATTTSYDTPTGSSSRGDGLPL